MSAVKDDGADFVGTLMYLAYGHGPHITEAIFSILTASRFVPTDAARIRYLVYTDRPDAFSGLDGVEVAVIEQSKLDEWTGEAGYVHRRKTMAMLDALNRYKGKLVFVDSDTCFQLSPLRLFDRVLPGKICLHLMENKLRYTDDDDAMRIMHVLETRELLWSDGTTVASDGDAEMWNSGVTGIDFADIQVLREALILSDQLYEFSRANTCEQFAMGCAATKFSSVSGCWDVIFHYWPGFLKRPFRNLLEKQFHTVQNLPKTDRMELVSKLQVRATRLQWAKQRTKLVLRSLGVPVRGLLRSA